MTIKHPRFLLLAFVALAVALVGLYIYFYQFSNLPDEQNTLIVNLISLAAPLSSAIFGTLIFTSFGPNDKPRQVWLHLTVFIWLWTIAEFIWIGYMIFTGDVPIPSIADAFWLAGFVFLTIGLRKQYELVTQRKIAWWKIGAGWAGVFVLTYLIVLLTTTLLGFGNYLEYFYAVADISAGIAAVRIFIAFRGGLMSRPWIGLFVLGLSDSIYAWLEATGMYATSTESGDWVSLFADTSYMTAYLVLAAGFLATYLVLKHGPESFSPTKPA
jgi:hypothetical protein